MIVRLNRNQFDYLSHSLSEEQEALKLRLNEVSKETQCFIIEIDEETADEIRDWAGGELQRKGFDINYEFTPEGKILEELIDLFYIE